MAFTRLFHPCPVGVRTWALVPCLALALLSCSGSDASQTSGDETASGEAAATGGAATEGGAVRGGAEAGQAMEPLTPRELAAYLPPEVMGLRARPEDLAVVPFEALEDGRYRAAAATLPYGTGSGPGVRLTIRDLAGTGDLLAARGEIYQLYLDGEGDDATEVQRLADGTVVLSRPEGTEFVPAVEYWIGNRFEVQVRPSVDGRNAAADPSTVERLLALYPAEPLVRLADGPDATPPTAAWLESDAEPGRVADAAGATGLPSCDALLPPGTVARICGVDGVRAVPTDFETEGSNCNRSYRPEAGGSGLAFIVTAFGDPGQASDAAALGAEPGPYSVEHDVLPDLGDGGNRSLDRSESVPDRYDIRFSRGSVLVEMNVSDSPFDGPDQKMCLSLEALEELAREVDRNLAGGG